MIKYYYIYFIIYFIIYIDFWNIIKHFDKEEENFNKICKHGLSSNVNKESLLAVYISKGVNKKVNYYSFPIIKKERWLKGAKTKYDIPQYIEGIPEGFAIFCTTKEAGKVRKYQEQIEKRNKSKNKNEADNKKNDGKDINEDINKEVEDMDVVNKRMIAGAMKMDENEINKKNENNNDKDKKKDKDDEDNKELKLYDELQEPVPRNDHKYCHICKTKFEEYLKHIKSYSHFDNLQRHQSFFNRFKKSFERIVNFWDIKNGRTPKNKNINETNIKKILSPIKPDEISTKDTSFQDNKNIINNIINLLNNNNLNTNNNENINNNVKNDNNINNNCDIANKNNNNYNNNTKKIINNNISNIDLNKNSKNIQNNSIIMTNNSKPEDKSNNNIFFPTSNQTILNKKKTNDNHIFNLTYNNNNITNNNINNGINININYNNNIFNNENNNSSIKTVNYISISQKDEENVIIKVPIQNKIKTYTEDKIINNQPKKKFVTKCYPKFSTLQTYQLPKPKKRKKNELYRGGDIFVISIPKKIDFDYFPVLSIDNSKKLINKNIIFFQ